jgi:hypothetical protein
MIIQTVYLKQLAHLQQMKPRMKHYQHTISFVSWLMIFLNSPGGYMLNIYTNTL